MPIDAARELFAATGLVTSAVVNLKQTDNESVFLTKKRIEEFISEPLAVKTWQELNALLINQMEADNKSALIMLAVLYLVIAFGVFGTVLMMMAERRREFGMLVSIGMQKGRVAAIVTFEMIFIGLLGVAAGIAASLPIVFYGHSHPIRFTGEMARMYEDYGFDPVMPTMLPDTYFIWQSVVVMAIILFTILFSIRKIYRIKVIDALKA
jgi:ABC-type lipoprotein release transport system permease subunit